MDELLAGAARSHAAPPDGVERVVRRALVARFGVELGVELSAEVTAWAWEHRERVATAANPAGLLFRVGQSRSRRLLRWRRSARTDVFTTPTSRPALPDVDLQRALKALPARQRTIVMMVHCFGYSYEETARTLGCSHASVRNHLHRALAKLRTALEVSDDD